MMKKVNLPTKNMDQFAGKWVAIDPVKDVIVAVGDTLKDIDPFITFPLDKKRPPETFPAAFKVPYKDEGSYYVLLTLNHDQLCCEPRNYSTNFVL